MEILIIVVIIGVAAWFFLSGTYGARFKDTSAMSDSELEDVFIEIKKQILVTSPYEHDQTYRNLYSRIEVVLARIIDRHKHFMLDVEARWEDFHFFFESREHHTADGMQYTNYVVPHSIHMDAMRPEALLYLCFFLWFGGRANNLFNLESDTKFMFNILDHLISQRNYPPAYFFKGMVLKYGANMYDQSKPEDARALLEAAHKQGVGAAGEELRYLYKYTRLEGIKSVHS